MPSLLQLRDAALDVVRLELRRVHADQERRLTGCGEGAGQAIAEAAGALRVNLEAVGHPAAGLALEHEQAPALTRDRGDGGEGVHERGLGEGGRLVGGARRGQPRLRAPRDRRLGDDQQGGARRPTHRSAAAMSRTVRAVPRTVPVTFERPPPRVE